MFNIRLFGNLFISQVNGIEMTGKTQLEAVAVLRNIEVNSVVDIVVSRQTDEEVILCLIQFLFYSGVFYTGCVLTCGTENWTTNLLRDVSK